MHVADGQRVNRVNSNIASAERMATSGFASRTTEQSSQSPATPFLPLLVSGGVIHGFGRGGRQLGCPTANLDDIALSYLPRDLPNGVYYGWAQLVSEDSSQMNDKTSGDVYKMVASLGYNPHFRGKERTLEVHILHEFPHDFYGASLSILLTGYIRPMRSYESINELMQDIDRDISYARSALDTRENIDLMKYRFLQPVHEVSTAANAKWPDKLGNL